VICCDNFDHCVTTCYSQILQLLAVWYMLDGRIDDLFFIDLLTYSLIDQCD